MTYVADKINLEAIPLRLAFANTHIQLIPNWAVVLVGLDVER